MCRGGRGNPTGVKTPRVNFFEGKKERKKEKVKRTRAWMVALNMGPQDPSWKAPVITLKNAAMIYGGGKRAGGAPGMQNQIDLYDIYYLFM